MDERDLQIGHMSEKLCGIKDGQHLVETLRAIDITVPRSSDGRKTWHRERWTICRLLATLAEGSRLSYPLSLVKGERPDFVLDMTIRKVGVEVSEAIPQGYQKYVHKAEKLGRKVFHIPNSVAFGKPIRQSEIQRMLDEKSSNAWVGDESERAWAEFLIGLIDHKLKKLSSKEFSVYESNWLSIYDNMPWPIDFEDAVAALSGSLQGYWTRSPRFDAVFIEHGGEWIACISPDGSQLLSLSTVAVK
ncbi:hypothetical protein [Methylocystis sp.]|uniref:hypothetical protein n=1 Tax=Methylocystis sp. TaxID=1911079 RepID=UPI0027361173|nr:hypothetical protein [Methylocystis sp.]MDP3552639.1 hypothetical protein [Methylocystis sp.]